MALTGMEYDDTTIKLTKSDLSPNTSKVTINNATIIKKGNVAYFTIDMTAVSAISSTDVLISAGFPKALSIGQSFECTHNGIYYPFLININGALHNYYKSISNGTNFVLRGVYLCE